MVVGNPVAGSSINEPSSVGTDAADRLYTTFIEIVFKFWK